MQTHTHTHTHTQTHTHGKVMDDAVFYNATNLEPFIGFDKALEPPVTLQLGGNSPQMLGEAARLAEM